MSNPRSHRGNALWLLASTLSWVVFLAALFFPGSVIAQGRCRCNNGCHQYPGQCVQGGSTGGCEAGYAAFCGNRGGDCPRTGWVSCSGECTCARIPGYDAGTADVPAPMDSTTRVDVPPPIDARLPPPDGTITPDGAIASDTPAPPLDRPAAGDAPIGDGPAPSDVVVTSDVPATMRDAGSTDSTTPDDVVTPADGPGADATPCVCPGGVCIAGRCITTRCTYQPELGFLCSTSGTTCRVFDGEPWCVPLCLDVTCADGEFCDESSGGECARDNCASIRCAGGLTCFRNQCGRFGDGGVFIAAGDGGVADDVGRAPATGVDDGGCGCRARGSPSSRALWPLALAALFARRRREARRRRASALCN